MFRPCDPGPILEALADELNVSVEELKGPSRQQAISNSRAVVHWTFRQLGFSLHEIGNMLHKEHSSVAHALKKVNRLREESALWHGNSSACLAIAKKIIEQENSHD